MLRINIVMFTKTVSIQCSYDNFFVLDD